MLRGGSWGGVILGEEPTGPDVMGLEWLTEGDEAESDPSSFTIRFTLKDGRIVDYAGVTPLEIWAAYNFVQPSPELLARIDPVTIAADRAGLVGKRPGGLFDDGSKWRFGVHPAIANTSLADAAMRLDMMLATVETLKQNNRRPIPGLQELGMPNDALTYQWYDGVASISVIGSQLVVRAAEPPEDCLMRVRLESPENDRDLSLNPLLGRACKDFHPLREIDRLARVVALFHWFKSSTQQPLPPLPEQAVILDDPSIGSTRNFLLEARQLDATPAATQANPVTESDIVDREVVVPDDQLPSALGPAIGFAIFVIAIVVGVGINTMGKKPRPRKPVTINQRPDQQKLP